MDCAHTPFDAISLSGGGSKGILHLGVLHYYYECGLYNPECVTDYSGTSIGSVISLLLVCGYTPMEIFKEIYDMDSFFTLGDCNGFFAAIQNSGLLNINRFADKIAELVKKKLGCVPSLKKLRKLSSKSLYISATNVTTMLEDIYSYKTTPKLNCIDAIKISCSLPLIFQKLKYNDNNVVDGGLINNCPWEYLPKTSKNILNVVICGSDTSLDDDTHLGYLYRLMIISINALTRLRCQIAPPHVKTLKVNFPGPQILHFRMNSGDKMKMFMKGYNTAKEEQRRYFLYVEGYSERSEEQRSEEICSERSEVRSEEQRSEEHRDDSRSEKDEVHATKTENSDDFGDWEWEDF